MIKSQCILVVERGTDPAASLQLAEAMDCVAVLGGVPSFLADRADAEGWVLPHVLVEEWEEQDPEPPPQDPQLP